MRRPSGLGLGVDSTGGPVIDPTENVLALVDVEKQHQQELRQSDAKYVDAMRTADAKYQDGMRNAEQAKQESLSLLKQNYDKQISDILTAQIKSTLELTSTQLDKVTASLSNQINAAVVQQSGLITTLSERIGRLEQLQWQTAGKTSVSDPAAADMVLAVRKLTETTKVGEGREIGRGEIIAYIVTAIAVATAIVKFLGH